MSIQNSQDARIANTQKSAVKTQNPQLITHNSSLRTLRNGASRFLALATVLNEGLDKLDIFDTANDEWCALVQLRRHEVEQGLCARARAAVSMFR